MTTDQLFRILILATLGVSSAISIYFRHQANRHGGRLDSAGNRVLLLLRLASIVVLFPLIGFLVNPNSMTWARYRSPEWLRWLGFVLTTTSIPALYWLFATIGRNISPTHTTRENHQLITAGPYRFVRHPLYTVGFVIFFGIGLMAAMWWIQAGLALLLVVLAGRTVKEEQLLVEKFGDEYRRYVKRTGRYLPRLRR